MTNISHSTFGEYDEIATPATPASGKVRVYAKSGTMFKLGSDAVEADLTAAGTARDTVRWVGVGVIITMTNLDGAWIAPRAGTITRITIHRRVAGATGSTTVDANKNGTTVFTTQANRPSVSSGAGADAISAHADMDVTSFAQNDRISVDVDAVETGSPTDLSVIMEVQYS